MFPSPPLVGVSVCVLPSFPVFFLRSLPLPFPPLHPPSLVVCDLHLSGKEKAHKHEQICPVTARARGVSRPGWGGGVSRPVARGQKFMCCVRNPTNINVFVRVPGREESGSRPGGSVTLVTEKVFMCQMFMCLFRPLIYPLVLGLGKHGLPSRKHPAPSGLFLGACPFSHLLLEDVKGTCRGTGRLGDCGACGPVQGTITVSSIGAMLSLSCLFLSASFGAGFSVGSLCLRSRFLTVNSSQ